MAVWVSAQAGCRLPALGIPCSAECSDGTLLCFFLDVLVGFSLCFLLFLWNGKFIQEGQHVCVLLICCLFLFGFLVISEDSSLENAMLVFLKVHSV